MKFNLHHPYEAMAPEVLQRAPTATASPVRTSRQLRRTRMWLRTAMMLVTLGPMAIVSASEDDEPAGYRMDDYDAMVPETLRGASVVDDADVVRLRAAGATLIDVIPEVRPPASLPANQLWLPPPHQSIPGSIWLPDVGYGELSAKTASWFRDQLKQATGGDVQHPLVFFCRDNCWMSWNAAKRALSWGYASVHWYPEGTDGWFSAGREFVAIEPEPGERY